MPESEVKPDNGAHPRSDTAQRSTGQRLLLLAGSIGPLGHLPASGTVAVACAGVPLYWLLVSYFEISWTIYCAFTVIFTIASIGLHHAGDKLLGESDSRKLVWDELVGFLFAMFLIRWDWRLVVIGFFVERAIDIVKIPPARFFDRKMHNGAGVVLDDVVAGIYTCALLHALRHFIPALSA